MFDPFAYTGKDNTLIYCTTQIIQSMAGDSTIRQAIYVALANPLLIVALFFVSVSSPRWLVFFVFLSEDACLQNPSDETFLKRGVTTNTLIASRPSPSFLAIPSTISAYILWAHTLLQNQGGDAPLLDILSGDGIAGLEECGAIQEVRQRGARSAKPAIVNRQDTVEDDIWALVGGIAEEFAGWL